MSIFGAVSFSTVKIDKRMVDLLPTNKQMTEIARSVIDLCHKQRITVIAEGVEHEEQMKALKDMECDAVQGYIINKPLPIEQFEEIYNI